MSLTDEKCSDPRGHKWENAGASGQPLGGQVFLRCSRCDLEIEIETTLPAAPATHGETEK